MEPGRHEAPRRREPLRETLESQGAWLFRWRSYLPLLLATLLLPAMSRVAGLSVGQWTRWEALCLAVSLSGVLIRVLVAGYVPSGTSGRNVAGQEASLLNTTGMYSLVRHPLYLGNYFMWLGITLLPRSAWLAVVVSLFFWIYYERIMLAEERYLREKFGAAFLSWATRTPAFFPHRLGWEAAPLAFSWRTVLRREYSGLFALVAVFALMDSWRNLLGDRSPLLDRTRLIILGAGLVLYLLARTLKRRRVLHVEGR